MSDESELGLESTVGPEFIFPPDTHYRCVGCGSCCRQNWVIDVEKECLDRLPDNLRARVTMPRRPQKDSPPAAHTITPVEGGGVCPLLFDDNLCVIHKQLGLEAKPLVCREFPFRFIETPKGVLVDVSFVCNEVLHNRGDTISWYREELADLYSKSRRKITVAGPVLLRTKTSITYEAYLLIEKKLLDILSNREQTIEDRLVAGNIFLFSICKNIYDREGIVLEEAPIERKIMKFRLRHISRLYEIAKKGKKMASRHKQQMFVVTFLTFASSAFERRGKLSVLLRTWANNVKQAMNFGSIKVPVLPKRVRLRKLVDVQFDPDNQQINELAGRYVTHCILRKTFVSQYGVFRGYNILLLLYGVIKWLSRVFALQEGKKTVEPDDFARAIQLVERQYVRHNEYMAFLKVDSRSMRFVDRLFEDLGFAPIIVKS